MGTLGSYGRALLSCGLLVLALAPAASARGIELKPTLSVHAPTYASSRPAVTLPASSGAPFAFPLAYSDARIGWVYRDPEDNTSAGNRDQSGLHSGLDFYELAPNQKYNLMPPIYSIGNGLIQSVNTPPGNNLTIWYPQQGVDAYYGYTSPQYARNDPQHSSSIPRAGDRVVRGEQIGIMTSGSGFNHLHL